MLQSNSRYVMHGRSFEFRIRKKNLISLIRKNKVKYKFPGIRYNIIIVTNALFKKKTQTSVTLLSHV